MGLAAEDQASNNAVANKLIGIVSMFLSVRRTCVRGSGCRVGTCGSGRPRMK